MDNKIEEWEIRYLIREVIGGNNYFDRCRRSGVSNVRFSGHIYNSKPNDIMVGLPHACKLKKVSIYLETVRIVNPIRINPDASAGSTNVVLYEDNPLAGKKVSVVIQDKNDKIIRQKEYCLYNKSDISFSVEDENIIVEKDQKIGVTTNKGSKVTSVNLIFDKLPTQSIRFLKED